MLCGRGALASHLEQSGAGLECSMVLSACHFGKITRVVVSANQAYLGLHLQGHLGGSGGGCVG